MAKTLKKDTKEESGVAVAETNTIAIPNNDLVGDFDRSDILIPSIRQVQKTGELSDLHSPGTWVLNQEEVLSNGADPVKLIVLKFRKYFIEDIDWDSGEQAKTAQTIQEVIEMGGTTAWEGNTPPTYKAIGEATVLVEGKNEAMFPLAYTDGTRYAPARWTLRNTAFKRAGRKIITQAQMGLKDGLQYGSWELSSATAKSGSNTYYVPVLDLKGRNEEELAVWADSQIS